MDDYDTKSHFNLDDLLTDKKKSKNKKFKSDDSKKQEDTFQVISKLILLQHYHTEIKNK